LAKFRPGRPSAAWLLAEALGIAPRRLRQKIAAERPIHDAERWLAAAALANRSREIAAFAERLTNLITEQGNG